MAFAHRMHEAFVDLDPGETKLFRFPPTTQGFISINVSSVAVPGGALPRDSGDRLIFEFDPEILALVLKGKVGAGVSAAVAKPAHGGAKGNPATEIDPNPDPSGGGGAALELVIELLNGEHILASASNGHLFLPVAPQSDRWVLRVKRRSDGSLEPRRYHFEGQYVSVLPIEERRIPIGFLQRGFEKNWSDAQYLEDFAVIDNRLLYRWNREFALLWELGTDIHKIDLPEKIRGLPVLRKKGVSLGAGAGEIPDPDQATPPGRLPYVSMHFDVFCDGSRDWDVPDAPGDDITLPEEFFIELRLYLTNGGRGRLGCKSRILTSLNDLEDVIVFDANSRLREGLKEREEEIDRAAAAVFETHVKPWLVGHYEITAVRHDAATDEAVIEHVGKPILQPTTLNARPQLASGEAEPPILFATARGEQWARQTFPGQGGRGRGVVTNPIDPGALKNVEHIVILMQENRSFDQVLGYLSRDGGHKDVEGLLPGNNERDVNRYRGREFRSRHTFDTSWPFELENPCHGHRCVSDQISGGMKSFVADYADRLGPTATDQELQRIMDYYGGAELPVYAELVREFAICDHWFCSHIGGTLPNRHILMSGGLNLDRDGVHEDENSDLAAYAPSERKTIFDHLTERGVSWKLYEHGYSFLRLYRKYTFDETNIVPFADFIADARDGRLPKVSLIEPDYIELPDGNDDHAPADMKRGQKLVSEIVRSLIGSKQWPATLLIITYDEHGGFYDHAFPPDAVQEKGPNGSVVLRQIPALANGVRRLGPRVPAFVVSPLIKAGSTGVNVSKQIFEHASIPATILRTFCGRHPPLLGPRVDGAADLRSLITLDKKHGRPKSDFDPLVAKLRAIERKKLPVAQARGAPVPFRKPKADAPDKGEDFHGFIAFASAMTGRGRT